MILMVIIYTFSLEKRRIPLRPTTVINVFVLIEENDVISPCGQQMSLDRSRRGAR